MAKKKPTAQEIRIAFENDLETAKNLARELLIDDSLATTCGVLDRVLDFEEEEDQQAAIAVLKDAKEIAAKFVGGAPTAAHVFEVFDRLADRMPEDDD